MRQASWVLVKNGLFGALKVVCLPLALAIGVTHGTFVSWVLPMCLAAAPGPRVAAPADVASGGGLDLVVCADVICYWTAPQLIDALRAMEDQLAPDGVLLLVHYRPTVRIQPLRGDEAHDLVAAETRLALVAHDELGDHRLDLFENR